MKIQSLESKSDLIYFDNSATSFPKPPQVIDAVVECLREYAANPGRSGHRLSMRAGKVLFEARMKLAQFFGVQNPMAVIFDLNATATLNLAIKGFAYKGLHVVTTSLEHNSTIRPLMRLKEDKVITLDILQGDSFGIVSIEELEKVKQKNIKLLVINHTSNVTGATQPLGAICRWCRKNGVTSIVDAAQSAGVVDIDMKRDSIDILCFTGHKGLYAPMGVGGMILSDEFDFEKIKPLKEGGTGSLSDAIVQPTFLPDRFESGTLNIPALNALMKGVEFIEENRVGIDFKKKELKRYFLEKSKEIDGIKVYTTHEENGVLSFTIENLSTSKITQVLSQKYNIMSRQGLHCSPLTHKKIGTYPKGAVRFSFGYFNDLWQIDRAVEALKLIQKERDE